MHLVRPRVLYIDITLIITLMPLRADSPAFGFYLSGDLQIFQNFTNHIITYLRAFLLHLRQREPAR